MALPLPNLDDKTFATLVEEAIKSIPRQTKQWTDHNRHDPGITFIELFAWLTEMQQYYLNQIRNEHYRKFLKLLDIRPKEAIAASADVTFSLPSGATESVLVPPGTKLSTANPMFETAQSLLVVPVSLTKVLSSSSAGVQDNTEANRTEGLFFAAFGTDAEESSRLYLGFDQPFPTGKRLSITFNLSEEYPVARGSHGDEPATVIPSAYLLWEYYAQSWVPLTVQEDETLMLSQSGRLFFTAPHDMQMRTIHPFPEELYWLRATVQQEGYELPPRLDTILLNTVPAVQRDTLSTVLTFSSDGQPVQIIEEASYLALTGQSILQVRQEDGRWKDWEQYTLTPEEAIGRVTITFAAEIPPVEAENVRLISTLPPFAPRRLLGRSNGLPHQTFFLEQTPVIGESLMLQVVETVSVGAGKEIRWRDWIRVDDFDASRPGDPHYLLNPETGEVRFGDGVYGDIPVVPDDEQSKNIRVIAYQVGGGESGNVQADTITQFVEPLSGLSALTFTNRRPASGGAAPETLEAAQARVRRDLKARYRAVTSADFELLTLATPGLRVARARAIPLFALELSGYPDVQAPATVTVVVVPYSLSPRPTPSQGFLQTVCRHLDKHRLITTKLHIIGPDYVQVAVQATVRLQAGFQSTSVQPRIIEALNAFLHPLDGGPEGTGWPFGRTVYKSEVYQHMENVEGVDCVTNLVLTASGVGISRDTEGNIAIPPQSLVYAGTHQLEIITPAQECR